MCDALSQQRCGRAAQQIIMKSTPFISVVVTTHRRPTLLARCLDSLLDQDFEDFEILLCTDESTTETREVAQSHLREKDAFLMLPGRKGPAATRNAGLHCARGEWICFLDDDDTFDGLHLQSAAAFLESDRSAVHFTNYESLCEDRRDPGLRVMQHLQVSTQERKPLLVVNSIPNNTYFAPRSVARACEVDETLRSHEDWDYLLNLQSRAPLVWHDHWGPRVHTDVVPTRNSAAFVDGSFVLDFLSIYRRWPAADEAMRAERQAVLGKMGLELPSHFL